MSRRAVLCISLLLGVVTFALYWPATWCDFVNYDDGLYVLDNERVQAGLTPQGAMWALTSRQASNWHPLTWWSHMLDVSLHGLYPGGHHLTNVLFHAANTVLLFLVLMRMDGAPWRCAVVAALFGWHPLHVESVAWVAERKDVLSMFFLLLVLSVYARYAKRPTRARYGLMLVLFALGLMAKPMLATLPGLLLLLDYWPLRRMRMGPPEALNTPQSNAAAHTPLRLMVEKIPFFILSLASSTVTIWAQHSGGAVKTLESVPFNERALNALLAYCGYLWKTIWPTDLAVLYPFPKDFLPGQILCSLVLLVALSVLVWRYRRSQPYLAVGWLWYVGTLVPVIGLIQVGDQAMADRYTYVPLTGVFIMIVWGVAEGSVKWRWRKQVLVAAAAIVLAGCLTGASLQLRHWRNSITLFEHCAQATQDNATAHHNWGAALSKAGRTNAAIAQFRAAVRLDPDYAKAHYNLGIDLANGGNIERAKFHFKEALRLRPNDAAIHNNFGVTLAQEGQLQEAIAHFSAAITNDPNYPRPRLNLAMALAKCGRTTEAIASYQTAIQMQPDWPEALDKAAWLFATGPEAQYRDGLAAVRLAERANRLTGFGEPTCLNTLAAAYAEVGRFPEAIEWAEKAMAKAQARNDTELASRTEERLRLYQAGRPYHQPQH